MRRALCVGVLFLAVAASALAQTGTEGAILGVVVDQSQAVVPGAEVVVQNEETGIKRTVNTNEVGIFEVLPLPHGRYTVSVSAQGFKAWQQTGIALRVGERMRVSPTLEVGQRSEKITVAATVQLLQTDSVHTGGTVEANQIRDLPLNNRFAVALVETVPGMIFEGSGPSWNGVQHGIFSVFGAGMPDDKTNFQVDGHSVNEPGYEYGTGIPSLDSIAEFSMVTSSFTADQGAFPMQMLLATKSGTNAFHGTLFEFLRNNVLDARNTFALSNPKLIRNQFGGAVGGPIRKNKTFFFFSTELTKIRENQIYNSTVVQPAMLDGYFSNPITDPTTGEPFPQVATGPYAGMYQIPTLRFSEASKFFFDGAHTPSRILLPNNPDGRFHDLISALNDMTMINGRVDHQIADKHRLSARWSFDTGPQVWGTILPSVLARNTLSHQNVSLNYTYNFSASTLLTLGASYGNAIQRYTALDTRNANLTDEAGIQGFPTSQVGKWMGMPTVSFANYTGFGEPGQTPFHGWSEQKEAKANVILIRGKHTINFGAEASKRMVEMESGMSARGSFTFNGQYTGDGFADYLLGLPSYAYRSWPLYGSGVKSIPYSGFYAQDAFNISPKLTLNYGVRFDYWYEKRLERGDGAYFDTKLGKVVAGLNDQGVVDMTLQPVTQYLAPAMAGLWVTAKEAGVPNGLFFGQGYVSPRIGISWRPTAKGDLVIRGGYGIYPSTFANNAACWSSTSIPYWDAEQVFLNNTSFQRWETVFPAIPQTFNKAGAYGPVPNMKPLKTHQWNISVQKGLPLHSALTASYLGSHTYDQVAAFFFDEVDAAVAKANPGANLTDIKPWPQYASLTGFDNIGSTSYQALHLKWERRFSQGLSFTASYAYGSARLHNSGTTWWAYIPLKVPAGYNDVPSSYDRKHILTMNWIWELPVGHGRKYMSNVNRAADVLLGGWEFTGLYRFASGDFLDIMAPGDPAHTGWYYGQRAVRIGDPHVSNPNVNEWFNPAAFASPADYTWSTTGAGNLTGPGLHGIDVGLLKNFRITESTRLQFRAEFYNAVNHVNLQDPVTTIGYDSSGHIYSAGDARQIQFGLKFIF